MLPPSILRVVLVPVDDRLVDALAAAAAQGPEVFTRRIGPRLGDAADAARQAVARRGRFRDGGFLVMDAATTDIVGSAGILHPATGAEHMAELEVEVFPPLPPRPHATAMIESLLARARDLGGVRRVVVHAPATIAPLDIAGLDPDGSGRWVWERPSLG